MRYLDYFLQLKCAGDVLNACGPLSRPAKEISEAVATVLRARKFVLERRDRPVVWIDLCSGNALVPVLAAHLFPNVQALAVDKHPRKRDWGAVRRFTYVAGDINDDGLVEALLKPHGRESLVVSSVHPCGDLARRVIEVYRRAPQREKVLVLVPCCVGRLPYAPRVAIRGLSKYHLWGLALAHSLGEGVRVKADRHILSPQNLVLYDERTP